MSLLHYRVPNEGPQNHWLGRWGRIPTCFFYVSFIFIHVNIWWNIINCKYTYILYWHPIDSCLQSHNLFLQLKVKKTALSPVSKTSTIKICLDGGWTNPSEKYARQIGSFSPIFEVNINKNLWNHQLVVVEFHSIFSPLHPLHFLPTFSKMSGEIQCWISWSAATVDSGLYFQYIHVTWCTFGYRGILGARLVEFENYQVDRSHWNTNWWHIFVVKLDASMPTEIIPITKKYPKFQHEKAKSSHDLYYSHVL